MARQSTRIFLPLDVSFMDDDKIIDAGEEAGWLYLAMALKCKALGVDGVLKRAQIARLHVDGWQLRLERLVEVHAVKERAGEAYLLPAYLKWNESVKQKKERLERDRARKGTPRGNQKDGGQE